MGNIVSVILKESKNLNEVSNSAGGRSNKFAFVEFQDVESVLFAVEMLDDIVLFGKRILVAPRDNTKQVKK